MIFFCYNILNQILAVKRILMKNLLIITLFIVLGFTGCNTKNAFGYGYTAVDFQIRGWTQVDSSDFDENSAFNRVMYEKESSDLINYFISQHGMPDYYFTSDTDKVKYGYVRSGMVYSFTLGITKDRFIGKKHYTAYKNEMPYGVVRDFQKRKKSSSRKKVKKQISHKKPRVNKNTKNVKNVKNTKNTKKTNKYLKYPKECEYADTLPAEDIKKTDMNCLIKVLCAKENKKTPIVIDEYTTIREMIPSGNTLIYEILLSEYVVNKINSAKDVNTQKMNKAIYDFKQERIKEKCVKKDTYFLLEKGLKIQYKYISTIDGRKVFDVFIDKKVCDKN